MRHEDPRQLETQTTVWGPETAVRALRATGATERAATRKHDLQAKQSTGQPRPFQVLLHISGVSKRKEDDDYKHLKNSTKCPTMDEIYNLQMQKRLTPQI